MSQLEHFASYLRRIDRTRKETENLIRIIGEIQTKNKTLYKDNVQREQAMMDLMSKPKVLKAIQEDKEEEEAYLNKFIEEYIAQEEAKKQLREEDRETVKEG